MPYPDRPSRYPTHIPVIVSHSGEPQTGYIVDINAYGACLTGVRDINEEEPIILRGAVEANVATVRWHSDDRVGVYFERPIPPQYLAMLRLRGNAYRAAATQSETRVV